MKTNNIQVLIRFLKEENIYSIVVNSIKYYKKHYNYIYRKDNIMDIIVSETNGGLYVRRLLEFVYAIVHKSKNKYFENIDIINAKFYAEKWEKKFN